MDRNGLVFCLLCIAGGFVEDVSPQGPINAPPVLVLNRRWELPSLEKIGAVVTRVGAKDTESDDLEFGLEPSGDSSSMPFRIDKTTGVVYLNETLENRVGQMFSLYVTVSDGELTAKTEVLVAVYNSTGGGRPPSFSNHRPNGFQFPPGFRNIHPPPPPSIPSNLNPFNNFNYPSMSIQSPPSLFPPGITPNITPPKVQTKTYKDDDINGTTTSTTTSEKTTTTVNVATINTTIPTTVTTTSNDTTMTSDKPLDDTTKNVVEVVLNDIGNGDNKNTTTGEVDEVVQTNHDVMVTVIPIVAVIVVFLVVGAVSFLVWRRYFFKKTKTKEDMSKEPSGGMVLQEDPSVALQGWRGPRAFSNRYEPWENGHIQATEQSTLSTEKAAEAEDRWEFPRHRLRVFNIVGEGAFGQVWRCDATDIDGVKGVSTVAVKTLKENASEKEKSDLVQELTVMKNLEPHPNVVRLLGCCTDKEPVFVIMEYIPLGKLQSYLRSSRAERYYGNTHGCSKTLTSRDLTSFAYQVARGMDFLSSKGIIHRDLAARNVLINDEHTCKVADFGFARDVLDTHIYERKSDGRLPIRWMAPESLYDDIFSVKSDVWSFGVFLWEVVTLGSTPYPGLSAGDVMRKVRDGHRLEKPEHCRRELYNIMYYCWDADPAQRPSFSECVSLLEKLLMTETDYIELERFPDHSYYNVSSLSGEKL